MLVRRVHLGAYPGLRWETFRKGEGHTLATIKTSWNKSQKNPVTIQREANGAGMTDVYWPEEGEDNHLVFDELVAGFKEQGWAVFRDDPIRKTWGKWKNAVRTEEPLLSAFVGGSYH